MKNNDSYRNSSPLCQKPVEKRNQGDVVSDKQEDDGTGGKVRIERFSDGSSTAHFGGPCAPVRTDKYGREC